MIFELNISSIKRDFSQMKSSCLIKFLIDSKGFKNELNKFLASKNLEIGNYLKTKLYKKDAEEIRTYFSDGKPSLLIIRKIDLKKTFESHTDFFRNYLAGSIQSLEKENIDNLQIELPSYENLKEFFKEEDYYYQTCIEGLHLGNYNFNKYKSDRKKTKKLAVNIAGNSKAALDRVIDLTGKIMHSVFFTRDLVNEPANTITPGSLAKNVRSELNKYKVSAKVMNRTELKKKKMNAILAVGDASDNPPLMIILHYKPRVKKNKKIVLVGKGVTYDTGGLSIKPTEGMLEMKADMAGAAVVAGTIMSAAQLNIPLEIVGLIPAVENVISGSSYKPGDIIKSYNGKTIEVKNTDAEGRIILSDALAYASIYKPDIMIDFATLTGACAVALGLFTAGLFTKDDNLANNLVNSGERTHERVWRLPFWDDFNSLIESDIADVDNLGPRWGGAITAGKFLENFVEKGIRWVHLDIAGPSVKHKFRNYTEKYDTGYGVRLMTDLLSKLSE
ncbi:M17 family metallopeptidase [Bacteroidota bacterium]